MPETHGVNACGQHKADVQSFVTLIAQAAVDRASVGVVRHDGVVHVRGIVRVELHLIPIGRIDSLHSFVLIVFRLLCVGVMFWTPRVLDIVAHIGLIGKESESISSVGAATSASYVVMIELSCVFPAFGGLLFGSSCVSGDVESSVSRHSDIVILSLSVLPLSLSPLTAVAVDHAY